MTNEENQKFTKLHKFLFTDDKYKYMKSKSKLLYAIITERQSLSLNDVKKHKDQSQFLDENKRLFSIYSNSDLKNLLNVSEPTIIKLKKELIRHGLLEEMRIANSCNRLYPKKPYDEYFYANDIDEFYRLPHALFDNPLYNEMSADSIIAYACYLGRYEYSAYKKQFLDKNNNIYFIYTNEELASLLNVERRKISKIKYELSFYNLLSVKPSNRADFLYINLPKASNDKELKKMHIGNLKKCTLGTKKNAHWELKKMHTSYTYLSNTYLSNTYLSNTTTKQDYSLKTNVNQKKENSGSSLNKNNKNKSLLNQIQNEFNIKLTKQYQKTLIDLFNSFDKDVIEYAIEYTSLNATSPKQYLVSILKNWIKADIKTVKQAKAFKQVTKNNQKLESKEMTPQWLLDRKEQTNKDSEIIINQDEYEYYQNVMYELDSLIQNKFEKDLKEIKELNKDVELICNVELNKLSEEEKQECFENKQQFINKKLAMVNKVVEFKKSLRQRWEG
ncbi:replication initiator protein A [Staphylococcus xylosus]|uniref:DnaD domain protein n=1 Tax=Staphylococcus xylosus TaxID=1288 RepID=UPI000E682BB2|nr:DnaD domain protein [Staphylococcus xylosus]RIM64107.1 DnaD domain protein [Staphylococcus xylosus]